MLFSALTPSSLPTFCSKEDHTQINPESQAKLRAKKTSLQKTKVDKVNVNKAEKRHYSLVICLINCSDENGELRKLGKAVVLQLLWLSFPILFRLCDDQDKREKTSLLASLFP